MGTGWAQKVASFNREESMFLPDVILDLDDLSW